MKWQLSVLCNANALQVPDNDKQRGLSTSLNLAEKMTGKRVRGSALVQLKYRKE